MLAKFLCGIPSPWTTRARLKSHRLFGACRAVPFQAVLNTIRQEGAASFLKASSKSDTLASGGAARFQQERFANRPVR